MSGESYEQLRAIGEAYERYIVWRLRARNPQQPIERMIGREAQYRHGDTNIGLEIKLDRKLSDTGNLYIETAEKTKADNPRYVSSGIFRDDASWWYGIGNYRDFVVFLKGRLAKFLRSDRVCARKQTPTSQGVVVPLPRALTIASKHLSWSERAPDGSLVVCPICQEAGCCAPHEDQIRWN